MRKSTGLALLGLGLVWAMAGGEARTAAAKPLESAEEQGPGAIVMRFVQQGSRTEFLKELQAAVAAHADRWYEKEFPSLIAALEHEPPAPSGYEQSPEKRSPEQAIRVWVYDLRDPAAAARFPGRNRLDPMEHLVAAGPAAMDALVAALDDDTPTRELGDEVGPSLAILLRRSDQALGCIEQISGITFFRRTQGRGGYFHNDAQRPSVTANVHAWWTQAKGQSQADGLRIQLTLWKQNTTLTHSSYIEAELLFTLAQLESPDRVIDRLRVLCAADTIGLNSPITEGMLRLDPQFLLRTTFDRLGAHALRDGDYFLLLKYGDQRVYQELSRRAQVDHKLDAGAWTPGGQAQYAATYGKNWAIPIVAAVLAETAMTGSRSFGGPVQNFCSADEAIVSFQELTGKDFGYRKDGSETDRLAAIHRAGDWWLKEGRIALADKIAAEHPSVTDGTDLLAGDDQIAATVARLASPDAPTARAAVASLGQVFSYRTRQALLARLTAEPDPAQRILILHKLDQPGFWQAPALAAVFEKDPSLEVRAAAGAALLTALDPNATLVWYRRLETRDAALAAVRRAADNPPADLLLPILRILMRQSDPEDGPRIRALAAREPARSDPQVRKYLEREAAPQPRPQ